MKLEYFAPGVSPAPNSLKLHRRGVELGWIGFFDSASMPAAETVIQAWHAHSAVLLPGMLNDALAGLTEQLAQSQLLMNQILEGEELSELFEQSCYSERLTPDFELTGASFEDHDDQGIEKVYFDCWREDELIADDLWCKASWLSLEDDDPSLRFRFSFGMEGYEDVASDHERQLCAARLTDAIFPESSAITAHVKLNALLGQVLDGAPPVYTERIVYFNAPNGGAQMHHDVERGHEGVVFAQLSGATFWLALSKDRLIDEIKAYLDTQAGENWTLLRDLLKDREQFAHYLEDEHELAEDLMDRHPDFFRYLIDKQYAYILKPGDVLLLPQAGLDTCVWHSVLCLGDETGEALSFALKKAADDAV
ncbi:hypothetical protein RP726_04925 [Candidatus Methylospira mobilis]|uniref:hypothetical protein n=1 Tax=Candidatus Methylospira mobilis TaxID=1808979 RepID=UPI0028EC4D33|nr:hypothetical protein [Candidatus Methylospira mobilis]WNV05765.1 hypothetical protein RP726_04925 [Candidatus Methylospira mobilis]